MIGLLLIMNAGETSAQNAAVSNSSPVRLGLLIGIEKYPNLSVHEQLEGCVNDTLLMKQVLIDRYQFDPADIVVLTNEQATGDGIRTEFRRLLDRLNQNSRSIEPAQVVVHFSGHGSQLPDEPAGTPGADELDGLDETLVPSDATLQGGPEDIRDDELNDFIEQVCAIHDSRIWMILDCCHSGTGARGITKFRSLERGKAITVTVDPADSGKVTARRLPDGAIVLSACQSFEKEPEYRDGEHHYGLLTRFLGQVLSQQPSVSALSHEALRESLLLSYRQAGVVQAPTPQLEGNSRSIVLSAGAGLDRLPFWKVEHVAGKSSQVTLNAGALQGITEHSLFELYERPDQITSASQPGAPQSVSSIAWIEIDQVLNLTANGRLFQWTDHEMTPFSAPSNFKAGYAVERRRAPGKAPLSVCVVQVLSAQSEGPPLGPDSDLVPEEIRRVLLHPSKSADGQAEGAASWFHWATASESADFVIKISGDRVAVFPATGNAATSEPELTAATGDSPLLRGGWGPIELGKPSSDARLIEMLRQIHRARNLLRITAGGEQVGGGRPHVQLELVKVELDDEFRITASHPWPQSGDSATVGNLIMRDGDYYAFRISNCEPLETGRPLYVTVLQLDSNMGIDVVLPYQAGATEEQLLQPGESRYSDPFQCNGDSGEPPIYGSRQAIVLATREPNDFYLLASPSLQVTRGAAASGNPLSELLTDQLGPRARGGSKRLRPQQNSESSWSSRVIQWRVSP